MVSKNLKGSIFYNHIYQMLMMCGKFYLVQARNVVKAVHNNIDFIYSTGPIPLSTYMRIYKKGDIVDIKVRCSMCWLLFLFWC